MGSPPSHSKGMLPGCLRRDASGASRRDVVRGIFAAAAGSALVALGQASADAQDVTAENCIAEGKRCGGGKRRRPCKKCCTRSIIRDQKGCRRCSCVRLGNDCSNDSQCCEGVCDSGTCQLSGPVCVPLGDTCAAGDTCCTGTCINGTCALLPACVPLQDICTTGDTCGGGVCTMQGVNAYCCIETGLADCTVSADCCASTATCIAGTCQIT